MGVYYDGGKLLSMKDIDGNTPAIYMVTSNRTAGKTTYFYRLVFNRFLRKKAKFMLILRYKNELDNCAEMFFKDIHGLFFPEWEVFSKKMADGKYHELFCRKIGEEVAVSCGYAAALNSADGLKKLSHFFSDVDSMVFDEFQSETNDYCPREVQKFISLYKTVARGQGKMMRYVPVYMCSNPVTLLNPYYVEMNISTRLNNGTKFLRGHGFVLEQGYNKAADEAQKASGFNAAFANNDYIAYSSEGKYLNDSLAFIDKPSGKSRYLGTIRYNGCNYGIRSFDDLGIIYCDSSADMTYPFRIAVTTEDHNINYVMLRNNDLFRANMRFFFEQGCFRFRDLKAKEAILKLLSY
jgi:hypothetical protein